jgi:hypothetical protein
MKRKISRISINSVKFCVSEVVDFWWWLFYFACRKRGYAERGVMPKEGLWMVDDTPAGEDSTAKDFKNAGVIMWISGRFNDADL